MPIFTKRLSTGLCEQVGKMDDPTTARLGEPLYRFIPRSIWGNIVDGWQAETQRLRAKQLSFYVPQNRCRAFILPHQNPYTHQ